jgi:hypothetical protein
LSEESMNAAKPAGQGTERQNEVGCAWQTAQADSGARHRAESGPIAAARAAAVSPETGVDLRRRFAAPFPGEAHLAYLAGPTVPFRVAGFGGRRAGVTVRLVIPELLLPVSGGMGPTGAARENRGKSSSPRP